jgi:hypothetical protein
MKGFPLLFLPLPLCHLLYPTPKHNVSEVKMSLKIFDILILYKFLYYFYKCTNLIVYRYIKFNCQTESTYIYLLVNQFINLIFLLRIFYELNSIRVIFYKLSLLELNSQSLHHAYWHLEKSYSPIKIDGPDHIIEIYIKLIITK